ncbi:helix-hairpin-helix domain-containing protein [Xylophilus sp. Kf1]|nr:helix-hairpin-helix domain-containing protein [Xylophilus sp. Kf1]
MLKKIIAVFAMLVASVAFAAVDVNKSTPAELDGVKGIGPVTSKLITAERDKGPFKDWDDFISRVKGVGDSRATKLSAEGLTINGASYKGSTAAAKPVGEKIKDGARAAADKTKEVAKDAKDKVTGK